MAVELAYVLVNPAILAKSRTGGVISRIVSRTGLDLVAARMFGPSRELADQYAELIRKSSDLPAEESTLIADHVQKNYGPDPKTGKCRRVMLLLFEGEDAIAKIRDAVGPLRELTASGETVRDTFGDFIVGDDDRPCYVEPAVAISRSLETTKKALKLWSEFSGRDGGIIDNAGDIETGSDVHRTLVIIKPDNFRFPSSRPGNIIELFSSSGLRMIGVKVHRMSVAEGEEFYGPVKEVLRNKLKAPVAERGAAAFKESFGFTISDDIKTKLGDLVGPSFGDEQFYQILEFMTGLRPNDVKPEDKSKPGTVRCLILIYKGKNAVDRIRKILGPTDPSKAGPGTVRKEYGKDIMINAAHASDSPENAVREMKIVKPEQDTITPWFEKYYAS